MAKNPLESGLGQHAQMLLSKKPSSKLKGQSAPSKPANPFAPGVGRKLYHPAVYAKVSEHIAERLKKLGG